MRAGRAAASRLEDVGHRVCAQRGLRRVQGRALRRGVGLLVIGSARSSSSGGGRGFEVESGRSVRRKGRISGRYVLMVNGIEARHMQLVVALMALVVVAALLEVGGASRRGHCGG